MTEMRFGLEVYGVKDAIRTIGQTDKEARKDITKRYKLILQPAVQDAQRAVPELPLSGFARRWRTKSGFQMLPWQTREASKRIKAGIDTRRPRQRTADVTNLTVFYVRWQGAVNTIYDMARNGTLGDNLRQKYGPASRIMWPSVIRHETQINHDMKVLMDDVMDKVNRKLK